MGMCATHFRGNCVIPRTMGKIHQNIQNAQLCFFNYDGENPAPAGFSNGKIWYE